MFIIVIIVFQVAACTLNNSNYAFPCNKFWSNL